jgi:polar amino acid transport system substrate-binding protein
MSFVLRSALQCLFVLVFSVSVAQARDWKEIKQQGKIVVATEGQFPPFNHIKDDKLTGFEVELMELIAKKGGVTVEWKTGDFEALLPGLGQKRWDLVIASHAITKDRANLVAFTDTHYCSGGVVVTKNPLLRNVRDLEGKRASVQAATSYLENIQKLGSLKEIKIFPQDDEARAAMLADKVDFWVTDRFAAAAALRASPGSGARSQVLLFPESIAAAVEKGNESLKAEYNRGLAAVIADGSYKQLAQRYFGDMDLRCP